MDLAYFLNQRLAFVEYFHTGTTASFQEVKRKIEAGEPPYVDVRDPEYVDEPAFFKEWEKADAAMAITGAACLDLLQSTLHAFLNEYMRQIGQERIIPQLGRLKQKSWLGNYKVFFQVYLQIEWAASGADLDLLEQVILARNDFTHNSDLFSFGAFQSLFHSEKHPDSAFADPKWKTMLMQRTPLSVPTETLHRAIETLRTLCEYLDHERYALTKRRRIERKAKAPRNVSNSP